MAAAQIKQMETNAAEFGITLHGMSSPHRGIVHVIGPELGQLEPGMTIVCGDSHTATHGAFGALAFGIGTSEVEHVLATQCLLQNKPQTYEVRVDGALPKGVSAKDIILALIAKIGIGGGTGHVFEYTGSAIRGLTMEQRMTICNMSIEGGARAGMVAPDDNTFEYLAGREFSPKGKDWDDAVARWKKLPSDEGATYDKSITLDAAEMEPMITYGKFKIAIKIKHLARNRNLNRYLNLIIMERQPVTVGQFFKEFGAALEMRLIAGEAGLKPHHPGADGEPARPGVERVHALFRLQADAGDGPRGGFLPARTARRRSAWRATRICLPTKSRASFSAAV